MHELVDGDWVPATGRVLDAAGYHRLDDDGKARVEQWLARHDIDHRDVTDYVELRPGLFRVREIDRTRSDGNIVRWERVVVDECPPPFYP
jgi:hypothetical protein